MKQEPSDPVVRPFPRAGLVSVIVPVFNEEEVLAAFHHRLCRVLASVRGVRWEILYVNDGSTDRTLKQILTFMAEDSRVQVVDLSRNFGKEAAVTAGIDHVRGDAAIFIDADLQDPPELIPVMVRHWRNGYDVVNMKRATRAGESWIKRCTAQAFYCLMGRIGPVKMPENVGDFRLLSRRALDALGRMPERNRMMKGMFAWIGFNVKEVPFHRDARDAGVTKWNYFRLWNLAMEGITSFTVAPLKAASVAGILISLAAFLYGALVAAKTLVWGDPVPGYQSLMVAILFLGGLQLLSIGIMGEYLGRVFMETKNRPLYLVKHHHTAVQSSGVLSRLIPQRRLP
ncbi:MAG: glycosyltransferase family 2 protein [Desulfobacteraceae bacterium]|nr:glycosyltransferase family 2 protein [Desulfobacteraceae bacterium]